MHARARHNGQAPCSDWRSAAKAASLCCSPSSPPPGRRIGRKRRHTAIGSGRVAAIERVVVIGCAGSGKSTLARQLAARTGLPLVERDALGEEGSPDYLSAMAEMAARPRWILDGPPYYADDLVYAAADTVVFLDYPKSLVLWRVLRRTASIEVLRRQAGAHRA